MVFRYTNESLEAMMLGLKPNKKDTILTVGGSGDQAFALLESGAKVKVIDCKAEQLDLIKERAYFLDRRVYEQFMNCNASSSLVEQRDKYLWNRNRLDRIRSNLANLVILPEGDIFEYTQKVNGYNKIQASNAVSWEHSKVMTPPYGDIFLGAPVKSDATEYFEKLAVNLPAGGLVYIVNYAHLCAVHKCHTGKWFLSEQDVKDEIFLPPGFRIEQKLTTKAREVDRTYWVPTVFERIA